MTLTIVLLPEEETRLKALAERQGMDVSAFGRHILVERISHLEGESAGNDSLADLLGDYIGFIQGGGEAHSENCGEAFTEHLVRKRQEGHL